MQDEIDPSSLQDLLENALDPILVTIGNTLVLVNGPALALTGYDRDKILRMSFSDLVHPDERHRLPALHYPGEPGEQVPRSFHTVLVCQDRSLRPVEVNLFGTTWHGQPAGILVLRDTSRRADEIAHLREIEQNLRFLIENTNDGILVVSEEGRYVYVNRRVCELTGYALKELLQMPYTGIIHPDEIPKIRERYTARISGRPAPKRYETRALHKDGTAFPVELTAAATTWRGRIADVIIVQDIRSRKLSQARLRTEREINEELRREVEERRRAEAALRASEERFRDVAEAAGEYIFELDRQGRITYVSERVSAVLGYRPEELLGRSPYEFNVSDRHAHTTQELLKGEGSPRAVQTLEQHAVRRDGRRVWLQVRVMTLRDDTGAIQGYRGAVLDTTAQKRMLAALQRRDAILEAVSFGAERLLAAERLEDGIDTVLQRLGVAAQVGRVSLYVNQTDLEGVTRTSRRFVWLHPDISTPAESAVFRDIPLSVFPAEWVETLRGGAPVQFSVGDGPELVKQLLQRMNVSSILALPVRVDNALWGFLGVSDPTAEFEWQPPEIEALRLAGNVFGAVIQRMQTTEALRRRDQVLEAVGYAAERLLAAGEWDRNMPAVLERLAVAARADQASLYENEREVDGVLRTSRRFTWSAAGGSGADDSLKFQREPVSAFFAPADLQALRAGHSVVLRPDRATLSRGGTWEGWETVLTLPILIDGKLWGGLGLDSRSTTISWPDPVREALQAAANLIGAAAQRVAAADALRRKDQILEAVSFAAAKLLGLPRWQEEVDHVLERLGRAADVDRVVIQEIRPEQSGEQRLFWVYRWAKEGFPPRVPEAPAEGIPLFASGCADVVQSLSRGEAQVVTVANTTREARDVLRRMGACSVLSLPVLVHDRLWGVIGFAACREERAWSTTEVEALRTAAEILGVAMERQEGDEALRQSEERYRSLVEGTDQVIALIDRAGTFRFANARALAYLGVSDLVGRTMWDVFPATLADRQVQSIRDALDRGELQVIQNPTSIRGESRWFESRLQPIRGSSVGFETVQLIATDITERKNAEEWILSYQERLRSLTSELTFLEQRERRRIAAELHDRIGQFLAVTRIKVAQLREQANSPEWRRPLDEIWGLVDQSIQDARSLTFELSPPVLYELGLEPALEWLVEAMGSRHGLTTAFHDDGSPKPLGQDLRGLLFQAAQELMLNVAKHAGAGSVVVTVSRDGDEIRCEVADDGCGFDVASVLGSSQSGANPPGFGLFSIRERLTHVGGRLEVESAPGRGTRAVIRAPLGPPGDSGGGPAAARVSGD